MIDIDYIIDWLNAACIYLFPLLLITIIVLIPEYIGKKMARKKVERENMSKIDFSKQKDYYRDILEGYSAAELRYIDDFKFDEKREIVATLLSLKLKNKIEIKENKITVLDLDENQPKPTEKLVLKSIKNGNIQRIMLKNISNLIKQEAIQDGLIVRNIDQYKYY